MEASEIAVTTVGSITGGPPKTTELSVFDKIEQPEKTSNAMENSIMLTVKLRVLGVRRKVSTSQVEVETDKSMLHVAKDILESETLKKIKSLDGDVRAYINTKCLPYIFRNGMYLLPIQSLEKVDNKLLEFKEQREALVNQFVGEYEEVKAAAEPRLGVLYNPEDYPSVDRVRSMFSMETRYVTFSTPGKLKEIAPAIWQREIDKAREDITAATDEIKGLLRAGLAEITDHLVEKLSSKPDGSRKIFRDSLIGNVKEFLEDFNSRNIVNDVELAALVEKAKGCIEGVNAKELRDNDALRDSVKADFATIKESLDKMLILAPKRQFDFSEDE